VGVSEPVVLLDVSDRIATITLNRPERRNAISSELGLSVARTVGDCEARVDVDVMIVTGTDPAFCAGVDLKEISEGRSALHESEDPGDAYRRDRFGQFPFAGPFPPHTKLIIGAINGVAITGGFELALNCDFLIASEQARFADTHARVGIMPGWGLTPLLVETIGVRRARELSVTGNFLDAATALTWGLVNHVVPHDQLMAFTRELATAAVQNDGAGVRRMLATYREIAGGLYDDAWAVEQRVNREWLADGIDQDEVGRRRQQVIDRGRTQL
jgi:enoyl-CoA hydratase